MPARGDQWTGSIDRGVPNRPPRPDLLDPATQTVPICRGGNGSFAADSRAGGRSHRHRSFCTHGTWLTGCILVAIGGVLVPLGFLAGAYGAFSEDLLYGFLYLAIPLYAGITS